jgi:hypothetical protein
MGLTNSLLKAGPMAGSGSAGNWRHAAPQIMNQVLILKLFVRIYSPLRSVTQFARAPARTQSIDECSGSPLNLPQPRQHLDPLRRFA